MHRWRIGDPDIPCRVASPLSLTPLLRGNSTGAIQPYRFSMLVASTVGHRSHALKIHRRLVLRVVATRPSDEPGRGSRQRTFADENDLRRRRFGAEKPVRSTPSDLTSKLRLLINLRNTPEFLYKTR